MINSPFSDPLFALVYMKNILAADKDRGISHISIDYQMGVGSWMVVTMENGSHYKLTIERVEMRQ